jgi:hypothetical protein
VKAEIAALQSEREQLNERKKTIMIEQVRSSQREATRRREDLEVL